MNKLIAVCLVKNEELYIRRVIENVVSHCDEVLVFDNMSDDETAVVVKGLMKAYSNITYQQVHDTSEAQDHIQSYIGEKVWMLVLDGDEIFDPKGISRVARSVKEGKFDDYAWIRSLFFHVDSLDMDLGRASGWMGPPSADSVKLHNLSLIKKWPKDNRTLIQAKTRVFKFPLTFLSHVPHPYRSIFSFFGFSKWQNKLKSKYTYRFANHYKWENSPLRCLHLRFIDRSSKDKGITKDKFRSSPSMVHGAYSSKQKDRYKVGPYIKDVDVCVFFVE